MGTPPHIPIDFRHWAITGIIAPAVVILLARFLVLPWFVDHWVLWKLGNPLCGIFILWCLIVIIAAVVRTIRHERHNR